MPVKLVVGSDAYELQGPTYEYVEQELDRVLKSTDGEVTSFPAMRVSDESWGRLFIGNSQTVWVGQGEARPTT